MAEPKDSNATELKHTSTEWCVNCNREFEADHVQSLCPYCGIDVIACNSCTANRELNCSHCVNGNLHDEQQPPDWLDDSNNVAQERREENIAVIAETAGAAGYYSGNFMEDLLTYRDWATEYERVAQHDAADHCEWLPEIMAFVDNKLHENHSICGRTMTRLEHNIESLTRELRNMIQHCSECSGRGLKPCEKDPITGRTEYDYCPVCKGARIALARAEGRM